MNTEEVDGSFFVFSEPDSWQLIFSISSADKLHHARAYRLPDTTIRLHYFESVSGAPQWIGTWWSELDTASIVSTENDARHLASIFCRSTLPPCS